jgi:hypothetical protein
MSVLLSFFLSIVFGSPAKTDATPANAPVKAKAVACCCDCPPNPLCPESPVCVKK